MNKKIKFRKFCHGKILVLGSSNLPKNSGGLSPIPLHSAKATQLYIIVLILILVKLSNPQILKNVQMLVVVGMDAPVLTANMVFLLLLKLDQQKDLS